VRERRRRRRRKEEEGGELVYAPRSPSLPLRTI